MWLARRAPPQRAHNRGLSKAKQLFDSNLRGVVLRANWLVASIRRALCLHRIIHNFRRSLLASSSNLCFRANRVYFRAALPSREIATKQCFSSFDLGSDRGSEADRCLRVQRRHLREDHFPKLFA